MKFAKVVVVVIATVSVCGVSAANASEMNPNSATALFEGETVRLADGWGDATACWGDDEGTRCYRTEAEMDAAEKAGAETDASTALSASCSSSVRLYTNTSFGGSVLALSTRFVLLDLSTYGFNNTTSSYRIGACGSVFYDGAGGGGPVYPGATGANASYASMLAGWDNRVSSIYIY